jgi:thiol:disulfide interchange protein DsbA
MQKLAAFLIAILVSTITLAADLQAGRDYIVIEPPLQGTKGKIEVVEFFSYACPHCRDFHPHISRWAAKLPKDVSFRRIPVSFDRTPWARLARIFYALELTGDLAKLDTAVFVALHDERVNFNSDEAVVAWAAKKGGDGKKFADTLTSFAIESKVKRGDQDAIAARIQGVPALVIDGRYLMVNDAAGQNALMDGELLKAADRMIAKARLDRKSK